MTQKVRGVIETIDGRRYLTRWFNEVAPAMDAADRLVERKHLDVKHISGMVRSEERAA